MRSMRGSRSARMNPSIASPSDAPASTMMRRAPGALASTPPRMPWPGHARHHGLMALCALVEMERGAAAVERHRERHGALGLRRRAVPPQIAGGVGAIEVPERDLFAEVAIAVRVHPYLTARVPQDGVRAARNLYVTGVDAEAVPAGARRVVRPPFDAEAAVARVDRSRPSHPRDVGYGV